MVMKLSPGRGLGPFRIGMLVSQAIVELQTNYSAYPVNFHYSSDKPLASDMLLDMPDMGFRLRFEPLTQRLRLIDVYDTKRVVMTYHGSSWSGPTTDSTFIRVYDLFGPTFPGKLDAGRGDYFLHYRGLSFTFHIPQEYRSLYGSSNDMPLELPDHTTPVASRVFIYSGSDLLRPEMPPATGHYCEPVKVELGPSGGVILTFQGRNSTIKSGAQLQDVLTELGPPARIFNKPRPKMSIHSLPSSRKAGRARAPRSKHDDDDEGLQDVVRNDYYLNYFGLGIDVLVDGRTHTVSKVVLHSNFPGHPEFNQYAKCNFTVHWPKQVGSHTARPAASADATPPDGDEASGAGAGAGAGSGASLPLGKFSVNTQWKDVERAMGGSGGRPMVHGSLANPFGPTYLYAFDGMVVEVMKESGHIASVTVFGTGDSRARGVDTPTAAS